MTAPHRAAGALALAVALVPPGSPAQGLPPDCLPAPLEAPAVVRAASLLPEGARLDRLAPRADWPALSVAQVALGPGPLSAAFDLVAALARPADPAAPSSAPVTFAAAGADLSGWRLARRVVAQGPLREVVHALAREAAPPEGTDAGGGLQARFLPGRSAFTVSLSRRYRLAWPDAPGASQGDARLLALAAVRALAPAQRLDASPTSVELPALPARALRLQRFVDAVAAGGGDLPLVAFDLWQWPLPPDREPAVDAWWSDAAAFASSEVAAPGGIRALVIPDSTLRLLHRAWPYATVAASGLRIVVPAGLATDVPMAACAPASPLPDAVWRVSFPELPPAPGPAATVHWALGDAPGLLFDLAPGDWVVASFPAAGTRVVLWARSRFRIAAL